ncbi:hypothetical protein BKA70DRAFT_1102671 [Coprinopsis sp. MPI-PUGE-AT-0042]|nr:hypothetical protein BKA70DRAFT_1102671 [Coprinopsis sp. MPI-PUGE-AT-0042]
MKTPAGTGNLVTTNRTCDKKHGKGELDEPVATVLLLQYSEANHQVLIALRCTVNQHPFAAVEDKLYQAEVAMLCPGIVLPSAAMVSCDCRRLYIPLHQNCLESIPLWMSQSTVPKSAVLLWI